MKKEYKGKKEEEEEKGKEEEDCKEIIKGNMKVKRGGEGEDQKPG